MAVPRRLVIVPNAATRELWRIAETGEIDELEAVLSRADVNARNEHGMTALMRAAYHGRVQMVRVLLEHGADPNVTRNDKFTALSLAAFFGHAEIVEVLMGHGAKTDVATRFGTSPQVWARARCFGDVARSLEQRTQEAMDPGKIRVLVQPAPRKLKARLVMTVTLLAVMGAAAGVGFYLLNPARSVVKPAPAVITATVPPPIINPPPETIKVAPEMPAVAREPVSRPTTSNTVTRRSRSFPTSDTGPTEINNEQPPVDTSDVNVVAPPMVVPTKPEFRSSGIADTKKSVTPPSSQMLSPAKTAQPRAKVIQWP